MGYWLGENLNWAVPDSLCDEQGVQNIYLDYNR